MKRYRLTFVFTNGWAHSTSADGFHAEQMIYAKYEDLANDPKCIYVGLFEVYNDAQPKRPTELIKQSVKEFAND